MANSFIQESTKKMTRNFQGLEIFSCIQLFPISNSCADFERFSWSHDSEISRHSSMVTKELSFLGINIFNVAQQVARGNKWKIPPKLLKFKQTHLHKNEMLTNRSWISCFKAWCLKKYFLSFLVLTSISCCTDVNESCKPKLSSSCCSSFCLISVSCLFCSAIRRLLPEEWVWLFLTSHLAKRCSEIEIYFFSSSTSCCSFVWSTIFLPPVKSLLSIAFILFARSFLAWSSFFICSFFNCISFKNLSFSSAWFFFENFF